MQDLEFARVSYQDLGFTMASIMFVYYYIAFYTGSNFIGSMGMLQIILTLPLALFIYRGILQITFFNQLHVLAIYLVLGIGADDIFVFMDGWNQSINLYHNTADRLDVTFKRAFWAMAATSSTTCVAFMSTAISPIMPIASFGWYAAIGVLLNYVLAVTLFPCTLMVYHYKLYGCCRRMPRQLEKVISLTMFFPTCHSRDEGVYCCQQPYRIPVAVQVKPPAADGVDQKVDDGDQPTAAQGSENEEKEEVLRSIDRFFKYKYAPIITKRPVAALMSVGFGVYIIISVVCALQLEPPTEQEQWFPKDHMFEQIMASMRTFASAAEDQYIMVTLAWGLIGMNRDDKVFWDAQDRGTIEYDSDFDLSTAEAQRFFLDSCDALVAQPHVCGRVEGCLGDRLVMPLAADEICGEPDGVTCLGAADACTSAPATLEGCEAAGACKFEDGACTRRAVWKDTNCWMGQFKDWCGANGHACTGADFLPRVKEFRDEFAALALYDLSIGIVGGELKMATISARSTLQEFQPNVITEPVFVSHFSPCVNWNRWLNRCACLSRSGRSMHSPTRAQQSHRPRCSHSSTPVASSGPGRSPKRSEPPLCSGDLLHHPYRAHSAFCVPDWSRTCLWALRSASRARTSSYWRPRAMSPRHRSRSSP